MNDPKLAGECRGLANQKMLADPVLTRLRLHGIVPNAGRSGQVVPGGLLTLFPVISGTRSPASAGGRNRLAGNSPSTPQARAGRRPCHSSQHSGTLSCIIRTGPPAGSIMSTGGNVPWTLDERTERRRLRLKPGARP